MSSIIHIKFKKCFSIINHKHLLLLQCFGRAVELNPDSGHHKYMYLGQLFEGVQSLQCFQKGVELILKENEERQASEV